jgi:hypothetical protein
MGRGEVPSERQQALGILPYLPTRLVAFLLVISVAIGVVSLVLHLWFTLAGMVFLIVAQVLTIRQKVKGAGER